jgi:hypothetical protein
MDLETIEKALDSLEGFPHRIGIMGGEPTKHPDFLEICKLVRRKIPKEKRRLHTSGYKWDQYRSVIRKTFGIHVDYNDHKNLFQKHHPMLLAIEDVVPNQKLADNLIDVCWVEFEGPGGLPIKKGWWDNSPQFFAEQRKRYCYRCGASVPFYPVFIKENKDYVSMGNFNRLKSLKTPRISKKRFKVIQKRYSERQLQELSQGWKPWDHWGKDEKKLTLYDLYGKFGGFLTYYPYWCRKKISRFSKSRIANLILLKKKKTAPIVAFQRKVDRFKV